MRGLERLKKAKGFTLIELAIVLVIIGIILGAVLKGQDLINNARAKKVVNAVKAWEVAQWTFFDRKGRFAGDSDKDGKIGDGDVKSDLTGAKFINPPYEGTSPNETNTISIGSYQFYVFFGTDGGNDAGKNVMIICKANDCATTFTDEELVFIEAIDVSIDGSSDGTAGQFIGVNSAPNSITLTEWEAYYNSAPTAAAWSTTNKAAVYYFDAKR